MKSSKPITYLFSFSYIVFIFFGLVIFLNTDMVAASYDGNETDHQALLSFKSMLRYPYGVLSSWNDSVHFCDWSGISCGKRHKRVTAIRLRSQGLEGTLSPHVGNLSFLRVLFLWNNSLQGTIPHELGRLSRLRGLILSRNKFHGVIPTNLSGCSDLKELGLANNKLVGSIPKEIGFLSKLHAVSIQSNNFTGGIAPFWGNITSMEVFSIMDNPFGGSIPDTLGHWKRLAEIDAGSCELYGTIPHFIYNLSHLSYLSLPYNHLTGSLHPTTGSMLPNLVYFHLTNNQLTGIIPPSLSNCSKLQLIELPDNKFTGKLTIDFSKLKDITEVTLNDNNLSGSGEAGDDMKFIDSLKNCSSFQVLGLYNCKLKGVLPMSIGNLSDQFYYLDLGANQLYGNIDSSMGNLVALATLYLDDNRFTGKIPSTIGELKKLEVVALENNQLSGSIPDAIGNLSLLLRLYLDSNRLEGHIPSSLGNCHQLLELSFSTNKLCGKIPKQLLEISSLSVRLDLSQNQLFGSLPSEVGDLKMLNILDLSDNNLSGNVPSTLGACTGLSFLSLKGNLFDGIIPSSLKSLRGVAKLDLSHNNLSGPIPKFLEEFSLKLLDLSFNDFEGEVPVLGIFANTSEFSVLSNRRLCGGLVELGLPKCKETKIHKKKFPLFVIAILIASALFTILFLVYAWFKKKSKNQTSQSSRKEQFLKVSYNQLLKATDGFSEANLIGLGEFSSVYKGILNEEFVAVKVLRLQNRRAYKSFLAECEVWRNIRHRNLLKIITSCSSVDFQGNDFKALVYELMSNGSLHDWLHSSVITSRLNLLQRINILLDVAYALDYLHNHCQTAIVHGDLKPSNILLDDDMVAHVGDFGLARFLGTDSNQNSSTSVKGTIGYAPPEYGFGSEMTSSGDVYSFGILLLEVMTGKKPTDDIFNEGLSIHKFAYMALPDHVTDVIDDDVIVLQSTEAKAHKMEECLASTLRIGVTCSLDSPPQRMNIKDVVHELQHIMDMLRSI